MEWQTNPISTCCNVLTCCHLKNADVKSKSYPHSEHSYIHGITCNVGKCISCQLIIRTGQQQTLRFMPSDLQSIIYTPVYALHFAHWRLTAIMSLEGVLTAMLSVVWQKLTCCSGGSSLVCNLLHYQVATRVRARREEPALPILSLANPSCKHTANTM